MRVTRTRRGIPRCWKSHPHGADILVERDLCFIAGSHLRAKLLIFKSTRQLWKFWRQAMNHKLGRAYGAVNGLATEHVRFEKDGSESKRLEVDPRYFCVIGLAATHLCFEIICHEAVHAAFCYAKRVRLKNMWPGQDTLIDEESVCYPAGRIARKINLACHQTGMYELSHYISKS